MKIRRKFKKFKVYSSRKLELTEEEKAYYYERIEKELEKFERDRKCGGMEGNHIVRLHDRRWPPDFAPKQLFIKDGSDLNDI